MALKQAAERCEVVIFLHHRDRWAMNHNYSSKETGHLGNYTHPASASASIQLRLNQRWTFEPVLPFIWTRKPNRLNSKDVSFGTISFDVRRKSFPLVSEIPALVDRHIRHDYTSGTDKPGFAREIRLGGMRYEAIEKDHISRFCRNRNKTDKVIIEPAPFFAYQSLAMTPSRPAQDSHFQPLQDQSS